MKAIKDFVRDYVIMKRADMAKNYIKDDVYKSLLDIGCGDMFFIKQFSNLKVKGIDKIYGSSVNKKIRFKDASFDYVTMLAVLEHLEHPKEVIKECARILKLKGCLIITVPFDNFILKLFHKIFYSKKELEEEGLHIQSFTKKEMNRITEHYFNLKKYKLFELGLNQLFVYEKK